MKTATYSAKLEEISSDWFIVDAEDVVLGRLASFLAMRIQGKHKPNFTPSMNCGDKVIVINAGKIAITGKKYENSVFYKHTGHPGGIKDYTPKEILTSKHPERVLENAVRRMITRKGPIGRKQLNNLFIYADDNHPHAAQKPQLIDFGALNPKNKKDKKEA